MISKKLKTILSLSFLSFIILVFSNFSYATEKFEKGDAIYTDMGGGLNPFWFLGHAGLYYYWEPAENENGIVEPESYGRHFIIQSADKGVQGFGENEITFKKFYDDGKFWGVKTVNLYGYQREQIIRIAKSKEGCKYAFFKGYKGSVKKGRPDTFRCDGLVEYCYEQAGVGYYWYDDELGLVWIEGIVDDKSWRSLTPRKQMNHLADPANFDHYTPQFDLAKFGELEDAICIDGEPIEPDYDGYYNINKNCSVKTYVCDGEYGSGIARFELWLGEPDDTPEKQGEDDNTGTRLYKDNEKDGLYNWYNFDWDINDVELGEYELYAKVFDQAGNTKETYINVKIEIPPYYFHVSLSPEYVETDSGEYSQTQAFTITVQCYNYGTSETNPDVEGERYVDKKEGAESWRHYINEAEGINEWRKEKINPDCIVPEEWEKSDYTGEVSFGIANITNNAYELYTGGEKLETLELVDGAGTISGVVIKAEDGNIGDNHLFLIIFASDGAGSGNGALMVNPIVVNVASTKDAYGKCSDITSYMPAGAFSTQEKFNLRWQSCKHSDPYLMSFYPPFLGFLNEPWKEGNVYGFSYFLAEYGDWQSYTGLRIIAGKATAIYDLSEETIGYAQDQIAYAWIRAYVSLYRIIGRNNQYRYRDEDELEHIGSIKNIGNNETGVVITDTNRLAHPAPSTALYRYIIWKSIPVSDFGDATKEHSFVPSLDTTKETDVDLLKPDWPYYNRKGIKMDTPQILFIPKTEE